MPVWEEFLGEIHATLVLFYNYKINYSRGIQNKNYYLSNTQTLGATASQQHPALCYVEMHIDVAPADSFATAGM